jgi:SOS-response transcriptional repressor LexA
MKKVSKNLENREENFYKSKVFKFIKDYIKEYQYGPSYPEIAKMFKFTYQYAHKLVKQLIEEGKLTMLRGKTASIKVV